jgi:hypothetical protein
MLILLQIFVAKKPTKIYVLFYGTGTKKSTISGMLKIVSSAV